jgi:cytidylate kinase
MSAVILDGPTGGGGRLIGPLIAKDLGYDYVDRLVLTEAARHVGATVEALHEREEKVPSRADQFSTLLQRMLERSASVSLGTDPYFGVGGMAFLTEEYDNLGSRVITRSNEVQDDLYVEAVSKVITGLADEGNVVIVGRGGPIILSGRNDVLRVGLVASLEDRISKMMKVWDLNFDDSKSLISKRDEARSYYIKRYFGVDNPDAAEMYHMVINTSFIGEEYLRNLIVEASKLLKEGRLA